MAETFLPRPQYTTHEQYVGFARDALAEMAALPGVEAAAVANNLPSASTTGRTSMMASAGGPRANARPGEQLTLANDGERHP